MACLTAFCPSGVAPTSGSPVVGSQAESTGGIGPLVPSPSCAVIVKLTFVSLAPSPVQVGSALRASNPRVPSAQIAPSSDTVRADPSALPSGIVNVAAGTVPWPLIIASGASEQLVPGHSANAQAMGVGSRRAAISQVTVASSPGLIQARVGSLAAETRAPST